MPKFPNQFAIVNDPVFKLSTVSSTSTAIQSKKTGPALAATTNQGSASLFLTGSPTSVSDYDFRIQDSGKIGEGTFAWKLSTDDESKWRGANNPRLATCIEGFDEFPEVDYKSAIYFYMKKTNLELVFFPKKDLSANTFFTIKYREYTAGGGGAWSETPLIFKNFGQGTGGIDTVTPSGIFKVSVCDLDDGSIILAVVNDFDVDLYRSVDGINFELYSAQVFTNILQTNGEYSTRRLNIYNISMASSGNYVSIAVSGRYLLGNYSNYGPIMSAFSSDGGSSWLKRAENWDINPAVWNGMPAVGYGCDIWTIGALDDEGTFILTGYNEDLSSQVISYISRGASPWEYHSSFNTPGDNVRKMTIFKSEEYVYFLFFAYSNVPTNLLPEGHQRAKGYHELYVGIWDRQNHQIGVDSLTWQYGGASAFNGGGHFFIHNITCGMGADNSLVMFGSPLNIYRDAPGGAFYYRLGGWDTRSFTEFNYNNATDTPYLMSDFHSDNNSFLDDGMKKLFRMEWMPICGVPTGGFFSNGYLLFGRDTSLWGMNRENSTSNWSQDRMRITDSPLATTFISTPGLLYKYTDRKSNIVGTGVSRIDAQNSGAITTYHYGGTITTDATSNDRNWAFIPKFKNTNVNLYEEDDIFASSGHGSCLRFITKISSTAPQNAEESNIVAGICTYLGIEGTKDLFGSSNLSGTRIINLELTMGREGIALWDANRFTSGGTRTPVKIGMICLGADALVNDYWEVRLGIHPYQIRKGAQQNKRFYGSFPAVAFMARRVGTNTATTWYSSSIHFATDQSNAPYNKTILMNQSGNHEDAVLNQVTYFGHKWALGGRSADYTQCQSFWKHFGIHAGNDANTLAYIQPNVSPVDGVLSIDRLSGQKLTSRLININDGISAAWGGGGANVGDRYSMAIDYDYAPRNLVVFDSPRINFETTNFLTTAGSAEIIMKGKDSNSMFIDNIAINGCKGKSIDVTYSNDAGTTYTTGKDTLNLATGLIGDVLEVKNNLITVRWNQTVEHKIRAGMFIPNQKRNWYFIKTLTTTLATGTTWEFNNIAYDITNSHYLGHVTRSDGSSGYETAFEISTKNASQYYPIVGTCFTPNYVTGSSFEIYSDRAWASSEQPESRGCSAIKFKFNSFERSDNNTIKGGTVVAGSTITFNPPFDWDWQDREKPTEETTTTNSNISYVYNKGPSSRMLMLKMEGDVDENLRNQFRNTLRGVTKYSKNPMFLVLGEATNALHKTDLYDELCFVRFSGDANLQNEGWRYDERTSQWNSVGRMSFKFVEVV